jgi:hypothetical protein
MIMFTSNHQNKQPAKTSTGSLSQAEMSLPRHLLHTDKQLQVTDRLTLHAISNAICCEIVAYTLSQSVLFCTVHAETPDLIITHM